MRRGNDRGVVLILAMLMVLVLAGLAMGAVAGVSGLMSRTGGSRVAAQAGNVTTSGTEGTMAFAAQNPSAYIQFVTAQGGRISMGDVAANYFDLAQDGTGSFGRDVTPLTLATWGARMTGALTTHRAPGFGLGEYCFRKYVARVDGAYRNDVDPANRQAFLLNLDRNAQAGALAELFVGPISCP